MARREQGPAPAEIISAEEALGTAPSPFEAMRVREQRDRAPRSAPALPSKLFVGRLDWNTTEEVLRTEFSAFGPVVEVAIITDRDTGRSRGFGFVTMQDRKDAARAIDALDGAEVDGRLIEVRVATGR